MLSQSKLQKLVVLFLSLCAITLLSVTYLSAKGGGRGNTEPSRRWDVGLLEAFVRFCKFRQKAAHPREIERTRFRKCHTAG